MRAARKTFVVILTLALLALPFVVWWKAQALVDWWQLRDYSPPAAVAGLARQDTMTAYAEHVFYVNHPDLETNAAQFRNQCSENEQTIVLGCYHSNQDGIYIYQVSDKRLSGVEQVTAAHEMLHAAYDRLSTKDKNHVDQLLQDYYENGLHDQRVIQTIDAYKRTEPNDVVNEMHSVFGTEVANLPEALEKYYQRYFSDRQAVVRYAASYQSEFTSRQNQIKTDDAELAGQLAAINQQEAALNAQLGQINAARARLDAEKRAGQYDRYNSDVPAFNAQVDGYNNGVARLKSEIKAYNDLVAQRNAVASELAGLVSAIDTRLAPQATQ